MKPDIFWQEMEKRMEENRELVGGGLPQFLAPLSARGGLHFWPIGAGFSLVIAGVGWWVGQEELAEVGRWLLGL